MKFFHFLLLASLCSASAASAQITPGSPSQGARGTTCAVPSGTAPMPSDPKGAVSAGEVFTTGAPAKNSKGSHSMKHKKGESIMSDGSGKMKDKM
ncbi:MAG: hypothetical protein ACRYFX_08975 [Janthinobacterium lividum]